MHVFIEAGLRYYWNEYRQAPLHIFEMGFGTGLNVLLTAIEAQQQQTWINYLSIEKFPLTNEEFSKLNYAEQVEETQASEWYPVIMQDKWNEAIAINAFFSFKKIKEDILLYTFDQPIDIIFYDAFAPGAQPELWTSSLFSKLYAAMNANGVLVTYCSKGDVRRALLAAGFDVKKIPGPPGKREMLRASKSGSR